MSEYRKDPLTGALIFKPDPNKQRDDRLLKLEEDYKDLLNRIEKVEGANGKSI